jgi:hypothetical protein
VLTPEQMEEWTQKLIDDPEKLNNLLASEGHFDTRRTLDGTERDQLFIVLKLIGPAYKSDHDNQRFTFECYEHNDKKYQVIYVMDEDPIIEEVTYHPLSRQAKWWQPDLSRVIARF